MEYLTTALIVFALGLAVAIASVLISVVIAIFVSVGLSRVTKGWSTKRILITATGVVPLVMIVGVGFIVAHVQSDAFRGPEILGIVIYSIGLLLTLVAGWPLSYGLTKRLVESRP